jgi:hypothetical protein
MLHDSNSQDMRSCLRKSPHKPLAVCAGGLPGGAGSFKGNLT